MRKETLLRTTPNGITQTRAKGGAPTQVLQQNRLRYRSLKKRLIDLGLIQKELARKIGLSQSAMSERMNGNVEFTAGEMKRIMDALGIPAEDLYRYFIEEMIPPVTTSKLSQKGRKKS